MRTEAMACVAECSLLLSTACGSGLREKPYTHYPNYATALADQAIARGWVPPWVPETAADIHEQHDIDTNRQCLRFSLPTTAAAQVREHLVPLSFKEIEDLDAACPFHPDWWFFGLIQQEPANDGALNAELYRAPESGSGLGLTVAIDRVSPHVYVWSE